MEKMKDSQMSDENSSTEQCWSHKNKRYGAHVATTMHNDDEDCLYYAACFWNIIAESFRNGMCVGVS